MKVAIIQEHVDARRGGAETSTLEMARNLAACGLDVTVVCRAQRNSAGSEPALDPPAGVRFLRVPAPGATKTSATRAFVYAAMRTVRDERFDIIHAITPCPTCHVYQPRGGTYVETIAQSVARGTTGIGRAVRRIGRRFHRRQRFLLQIERQLLDQRPAPYVVAVSEHAARQARRAYPTLPEQRVRVVFNGVDIQPLEANQARRARTQTREKLGIDPQAPVVLFVAHNFKLKGLAELIVAMGGLPQPRPLLLVAGRGASGPFARAARRSAVPVRFLGPAGDVRALYYAADLLAHPTWYDPCSRVVLEALVCGLPVVTTRLNGAAEAIAAQRSGYVVDSPRERDALCDALRRGLDPAVRTTCAAEAPALRERLSMRRHARELAELYRELAGGSAPGTDIDEHDTGCRNNE